VKYRIGTRRSELATIQSRQVAEWLTAQGLQCELVIVDNTADLDLHTPLYQIESEGPGLFTKQLETALLQNQIDLAVHSLKDLPTEQPTGLRVGAISPRVVAGDCLVVSSSSYLATDPVGVKKGAMVGTSSLRREAELLSVRPDLTVVAVRGNVPTRIRRVREGKMDAVVLAQAGLFRLGLDLEGVIQHPLPSDIFVSAPGQGALAIEVRNPTDPRLAQSLDAIHDETTAFATTVERRILRELEGGCTLPLGVFCEKIPGPDQWKVTAFLGLLRDQTGAPKEWAGFHRFDISGPQADTLVHNTVRYFKEKKA
jgi:hydroxymethylbilane synthase